MKKAIIWLAKAVMAVIVSIFLLSVFTTLYSNTGIHIKNETGATDYKWKPYQFKSTMGEGFSWKRMNGDGFNNAFNLSDTDRIDILLMGSSHMEAINVAYDKNTGYLLNQMFADKVTYNIGMSGHTIYQCAKNIKSAVEYYNPKSYIVIETDRIDLDENMMRRTLDGELSDLESTDSGVMYRIQQVAPCFQSLYRRVKKWIDSGNDSVDYNLTEMSFKDKSESYLETLDGFIGLIAEGAADRQVIIVYHPATFFSEDGKPQIYSSDSSLFRSACEKQGIEFIDMYEEFEDEFENHSIMAHGFINSAVGQGHLNENGHKMIATSVYKSIRGLENGTD